MEINGMVCAAESNGSNAAFAMHEQYSSMPMRMPNSTANRNPTVPSSKVTCVAGHNVGHVSTVACAISLGAAIMVLGTLPMRTHASHTASNSTTAITVGIRRLQTWSKGGQSFENFCDNAGF